MTDDADSKTEELVYFRHQLIAAQTIIDQLYRQLTTLGPDILSSESCFLIGAAYGALANARQSVETDRHKHDARDRKP